MEFPNYPKGKHALFTERLAINEAASESIEELVKRQEALVEKVRQRLEARKRLELVKKEGTA